MESYYIRKVRKKKGETIVHYEITNLNEYTELEQQITKALEQCIIDIDKPALSQSKCSTVPECSTIKMEQTT